MKRFVILVFAVLFTLLPEVQADPHVATVKKLSNNSEINRGSSVLIATAGLKLMNGDVILTKANSSVGVIFIDGTSITVGPDSEFRINNYIFKPNIETYAFSVYLNKGSALFDSGKISRLSPESVKLSTPRATVGIRGTRFIVEVN